MKKKLIIGILILLAVVLLVFNLSDSPAVKITTLPLISQHEKGYPRGCEGVSLYMAMRGMGYLEDVDLHSFMNTMPIGETPHTGFMGDATIGNEGDNIGKRTTIYPAPLASWGDSYAEGHVVNLQGATLDDLKAELDQHHPLVVYVTGGWQKTKWQRFDWGWSVRNNHALCLVGYSSRKYYVCDCGGAIPRYYWVKASVFEPIYQERYFAVAVR